MRPILSPIRCEYALDGVVGDYLRAVTEHWLLTAPAANPAMLEMFSDRDTPPYRDMVPWAGEFAGKYLTGAVQVWRTTGDRRLETQIAQFVRQLVARQAVDGYLGPWPADARLTNFSGYHGERGLLTWDTWGHYHIMLGLMLWHQATGDPSSLSCACRIADLICAKYLGDRYPRLVETGSTEMNLAPVHALSILARQTRHPQYLAMARQIVAEFGAQADGRSLAGDWLRLALAGTPFFAMPKPRWESLHPIMGLAELYWTTGEAAYREAFEHIWWSIAEADRHNNGGFSSGEQATGNPYDPRPIETCCTIAWIATSVEMLKLTGNSVVADEIELSTLNSVVGMHSRSGRWATYNTPSDGARFASAHYIVFQARSGSPELNCCSVNSPRGLGMIGDWAVMQGLDGLYLNYYGPARIALRLDSQGVREHQGRANRLEIVLETDYPRSGHLVAHIRPELSCELAIFFRIPYWSAHTDVTVNGERVPDVQPGTYLSIERTWRNGDIVELDLDMSPHFWRGERECDGLTSAYRGPLLLTYDHRYNRSLHTAQEPVVYGGDPRRTSAGALPVPTLDARSLRAASVAWDDWLPPTLLLEAATADGRTVQLCDYASAGQTGSLYRSWLPFDNCPHATGFSRQNPLRSTHSGS